MECNWRTSSASAEVFPVLQDQVPNIHSNRVCSSWPFLTHFLKFWRSKGQTNPHFLPFPWTRTQHPMLTLKDQAFSLCVRFVWFCFHHQAKHLYFEWHGKGQSSWWPWPADDIALLAWGDRGGHLPPSVDSHLQLLPHSVHLQARLSQHFRNEYFLTKLLSEGQELLHGMQSSLLLDRPRLKPWQQWLF